MRRISFRQVLEIVSGKPVEELILVGGQALNAWAEALEIAGVDRDGVYGAALSDDIDFLGMAPAAIAFADALGAEIKVAGMDDHGPNTAIVTFDFEGERNVIDFLATLKGFSAAELERVRQWAAVPELPAAVNDRLRVMHPVHCLQSQLENVYGAALNRRESVDGQRNARRVQLAAEVVRRTVARYLGEDDAASARAVVESVHELAGRSPALRALKMDRIDVVDGLAGDLRLGEDFLQKRVPQLARYLARAVAKHEARERRRSR